MQLRVHCLCPHFLFVCFAMVIIHFTTTCISNPPKTNAEIFASKCLMYLKKLIKYVFLSTKIFTIYIFFVLYWRFEFLFYWRFEFLSYIIFLKLKKPVLVFLILQVCWWQILLVFSHFLYIVPSFLRDIFTELGWQLFFCFALLSAL